MTSIPIAVKKETPQVVGPFTVTAAEMTARSGGGYAGGVPLFTPAAGSVVLAAWAVVTETWVVSDPGTSVHCRPDTAFSVPVGFGTGTAGDHFADSSNIDVADGTTEIRVYPDTTFAASAGATDVRFLVIPTG